MNDNKPAMVKVGNEVSNWFHIESRAKKGCVLSH